MSTRKEKPWQEVPLFDVSSLPTADQESAARLEAWWRQHAEEEAAKTIPKAIEYGSADLDLMGDAMLALLPQLNGKVPKQELAVAFYMLGKVARLFGAYEKGRAPSIDTLLDIGVYARMAQYVRENGEWR